MPQRHGTSAATDLRTQPWQERASGPSYTCQTAPGSQHIIGAAGSLIPDSSPGLHVHCPVPEWTRGWTPELAATEPQDHTGPVTVLMGLPGWDPALPNLGPLPVLLQLGGHRPLMGNPLSQREHSQSTHQRHSPSNPSQCGRKGTRPGSPQSLWRRSSPTQVIRLAHPLQSQRASSSLATRNPPWPPDEWPGRRAGQPSPFRKSLETDEEASPFLPVSGSESKAGESLENTESRRQADSRLTWRRGWSEP